MEVPNATPGGSPGGVAKKLGGIVGTLWGPCGGLVGLCGGCFCAKARGADMADMAITSQRQVVCEHDHDSAMTISNPRRYDVIFRFASL